MSWYSWFTLNAEERRVAWENARTYRLIRSLPEEVQKDIGWPDGPQAHRIRRKENQL